MYYDLLFLKTGQNVFFFVTPSIFNIRTQNQKIHTPLIKKTQFCLKYEIEYDTFEDNLKCQRINLQVIVRA